MPARVRLERTRGKSTASTADKRGMRARILAAGAILAALTSGCATQPVVPRSPEPPPAAAAPEPASRSLQVQVREGGVDVVRTVGLEEYVAAAALSEFAPAAGEASAVEAMFEVQAIIARTYAVAHLGRHAAGGFDLCSSTHCQLYEPGRLTTSRWSPLVQQAVARTAGLVLAFDGGIADAVYHADCGGRTSAAADVWGGAGAPYLRAEVDDGDAAGAHAGWQYAVDRAALLRALDGDPRTRVGRTLRSITVPDARQVRTGATACFCTGNGTSRSRARTCATC